MIHASRDGIFTGVHWSRKPDWLMILNNVDQLDSLLLCKTMIGSFFWPLYRGGHPEKGGVTTFDPSSLSYSLTAAWIKYGRDAESCISVRVATHLTAVLPICCHFANNFHRANHRCLSSQQTGAFKRRLKACADVDGERLMIYLYRLNKDWGNWDWTSNLPAFNVIWWMGNEANNDESNIILYT